LENRLEMEVTKPKGRLKAEIGWMDERPGSLGMPLDIRSGA
jgi:hypothetical protein